MCLDLCVPVEPESAGCLSLDALVDEVCGFNGPAVRNLVTLDLDLARNDLISDFTSAFSCVRSTSVHALVANDSHRKVVSSDTMVLTTHHFGSHVARGT